MKNPDESDIRDRIDACLVPVCVAGQGHPGFTSWVLDVKVSVEKLLDQRRLLENSHNFEISRTLEFDETLANEASRLTSMLQNISIETNNLSGKFHDNFLKSFGVADEPIEDPIEMSSFDLREYDPRIPWFRRIFIELGELAGSCVGIRKK